MRQTLVLIVLLITFSSFSQSTRKIIKDFDGDKKLDTVYIDSDVDKLFCILSTNNYIKKSSLEIRSLNFGNTLVETTKGFEFWNDYGRSGFINEFLYNSKIKKMQLVKIQRTDYNIDRNKYGKEVRFGSGKSSINLITNKYVGDFYYVYKGKLRKLPIIKETMVLPETYIDSFSDAIYFKFEKKCIAHYEKAKKIALKL